MSIDPDQLGSLPPGTLVLCSYVTFPYWVCRIMGYEEARRQVNLCDERDTIGRIKNGEEDGCAVMFFGEQTCAIMPVDRVEPHACVTGVYAETFRTWIWEASISQQVYEGWAEFTDEIRNRFDRAFDIANEYALRQFADGNSPEFVVLSGCATEGGVQNGLLPCGSLVWCCVENEPVWPCRVVGLRPNDYEKLRKEMLAEGHDPRDKTEPILFFGEDSIVPPPTPVLASLSDCSVFIPGEEKQWIPHYRLRSIKIAQERKFKKWSDDIWDSWDVACEIACDCARTGSIDPIFEWMSQPSSPPRRRCRMTQDKSLADVNQTTPPQFPLGHGPYYSGVVSRETSPSVSSSLPLRSRKQIMDGLTTPVQNGSKISARPDQMRNHIRKKSLSQKPTARKSAPKHLRSVGGTSNMSSKSGSSSKKNPAKNESVKTKNGRTRHTRAQFELSTRAKRRSPPPLFRESVVLESEGPTDHTHDLVMTPAMSRNSHTSRGRAYEGCSSSGPAGDVHDSVPMVTTLSSPVVEQRENSYVVERAGDVSWPALSSGQSRQRVTYVSGISDIYSEFGC